RGVFAKNLFQKGDFVVEYRGKLISSAESERRRKIYHSKCTVFMFDFYWQDKLWCIDASQEDDSLGRLINDDYKNPNCKMKKILANGKPHLCLFALRNINPGEEITYDYGGKDWPWRQKLNQPVNFDSDELFDPMTSDSGDEYVPDSCEDSSDGTDNSGGDNSVACPISPVQRGRSPTKKRNDSGPKSKSRRLNSVPSRTPQISWDFSSKEIGNSDTEEQSSNATPVLESCLDKSTTQVFEDESATTLSIPAVQKKEDGSRMYNKRQYCLYCQKGFIKIARHLERAHPKKPEVAQAMALPKGSKERRLHLEHLRNRGNFSHNVEVMNTGTGTLVPRKLPQNDQQTQDFLHCSYCQGLFRKEIIWRHMKICKFKPQTAQKPGKTRAQALCAFAVPPPPGVSADFWKMLSKMNQDEVCLTVKSDNLIMKFGEHLFNRLGYDVGKHEYIRQKMRELGRLLICSRKITPLRTIKDHIMPQNFMHVITSVRVLAGYITESKTFKCPSLALKTGHNLTKISELVESQANIQMNYAEAKAACAFRKVYEARWNEFISAASLRTLREAKWNAPQLLPFTEDVMKLHSYLEKQQNQYCTELSTETSPQTWANLAKVTLGQVILFNRRRSGEVSKIPLTAYLSSNDTQSPDDVSEALSDLEKKLCKHFRRIEIRGKRERKVPVLLTPMMQQSLDILVSKRQECGVPEGNTYLFARPSAWSCYRGSDCLRHFAKVCGAKNPENLTSTRLRKQTGTLSQVLNLSNTELDQLADFLGHDIRVHRQFYRLPEGTLQLAKISKVLLAMEQGRLAEFKGKSLDDICIDPEVRRTFKRRVWEKEEILAVEKHMRSFITSCRVPGKRDCDKCLQQENVALKNRNWLGIKFYVKNRITALKNKF
ncbi:N-lysine methyltransferase SETD8-A, partial [Oryzias melastigma]